MDTVNPPLVVDETLNGNPQILILEITGGGGEEVEISQSPLTTCSQTSLGPRLPCLVSTVRPWTWRMALTKPSSHHRITRPNHLSRSSFFSRISSTPLLRPWDAHFLISSFKWGPHKQTQYPGACALLCCTSSNSGAFFTWPTLWFLMCWVHTVWR